MKKKAPYTFNSISEFHSVNKLRKPTNPLVSVVRLEDINPEHSGSLETIIFNFHTIFLKRNFDGTVKYGQQYYDFDSGTMSFYAPKQLVGLEGDLPTKLEGWMLVIHPDFLHSYPLAKKNKGVRFLRLCYS